MPYHLFILAYAWRLVKADVSKRLKDKTRSHNTLPTRLEMITGFICIGCYLCNCFLKYQQNTLIFMFNPCHVAILFLAVTCFTKYGVVGEISAMCVYSFAFGGYIGIIFNENYELSPSELVLYYVEHAYTSALGPLILNLSGRYDFASRAFPPYPFFGFGFFSFYMRYFLMPLSALTWANLNHTLCGLDNDPFYKAFDLGKSYYGWSELYLLGSCFVGYLLNYIFIRVTYIMLRLLGITKLDQSTKAKNS